MREDTEVFTDEKLACKTKRRLMITKIMQNEFDERNEKKKKKESPVNYIRCDKIHLMLGLLFAISLAEEL